MNIEQRAMNAGEREKLILDFISHHQGCTVEKVVKELQNQISRQTVFNILKDLRELKQITANKKKPNSRDLNLYVNSKNPLVFVPAELDELEQVFISFVKKMKEKNMDRVFNLKKMLRIQFQMYKKEIGKKEDEKLNLEEIRQLMEDPMEDMQEDFNWLSYFLSIYVRCLQMFRHVVQIYSIRSLEWHNTIEDKDLLNKLLFTVFTRISAMQTQIVDIINSASVSNIPDPIEEELSEVKFFDPVRELAKTLDVRENLNELSEYYEAMDLQEEAKPVLNSLLVLSKSLPNKDNELPFGELGVADPLGWSKEDIREFTDPETIINSDEED